MNIEVNAQAVIDELLAQNRQLVAEISILRAALSQENQEETNNIEK